MEKGVIMNGFSTFAFVALGTEPGDGVPLNNISHAFYFETEFLYMTEAGL